MSNDDKKRVNIEDLPVPLKDLDKEEEDNLTGGIGGVNPSNPTLNPSNPTLNPSDPKLNPNIPTLNPDLKNPTFNK